MTATNHIATEEIVFKPNYPMRILLSVYMYPVGVVACIVFIYLAIVSRSIFPNIIFALVIAFTLFSMPMILFREVRFGEVITVKRYFRPRRIIRYEDVVELTHRGLVANRGGIPLANVQNRSEFEKIIKRLASQHKIKLKKSIESVKGI